MVNQTTLVMLVHMSQSYREHHNQSSLVDDSEVMKTFSKYIYRYIYTAVVVICPFPFILKKVLLPFNGEVNHSGYATVTCKSSLTRIICFVVWSSSSLFGFQCEEVPD